MPLLFSPTSEDILEGPFKPYPRNAFMMLHSGTNVSASEAKIDAVVCRCLSKLKHPIRKASRQRGTKDYLDKIIQLIRGCGLGVAIFSELTPAATLANIFFEIGLCGLLGKPVILIKTADAKPPSDFVRTEWISFQEPNTNKLSRDVRSHVDQIRELADYYENLGDLAMAAEDVDLELAFERYRQATLIIGKKAVRNKIRKILIKLGDSGKLSSLQASRTRLRKSIQEFDKLLPRS
ncbi:MAG TPA: hypothetical protein VEW46_18715 [Pyrinomonadaceae bacterium]|nr:hypothetical protein [Pyrinomonadaceae bacterium]